jgi:hypothetical protein
VLTITGLTAGTYQNIRVQLGSCVSNLVGPFTLTDPSNPAAATFQPITAVCSGNTLVLNATSTTPGVTYSWAGPNSFTSNQQNPSIANASVLASGNYTVTVGKGGDAPRDYQSSASGNYGESNNTQGNRGDNSVFGDITALGGGGGNESFYTPSNFISGGSGGGGGDFYQGVRSHNQIGGAATQGNSGGGLGYGNPGGSRGPGGPTPSEDGTHAGPHEGAGGGGAGGTSTGGNSSTPSNGGVGRQYTQFAAWGSPAGWFAGGGGGGLYSGSQTPTNTNVGGYFGGGGKGAGGNSPVVRSTAGTPNTGGGGGGGSGNNDGTWGWNGGGSGIVVLRYQT